VTTVIPEVSNALNAKKHNIALKNVSKWIGISSFHTLKYLFVF